MSATAFGTWDYAIFGVMVGMSLSIGVYHAVKTRARQSTTEYLVAGHSMTFIPVTISLIASYQSSILMLGTPAEGYVYGVPFVLGELSMAAGRFLEIFLVFNFLWRLQLSSPYEFLERRFKSRGLRLLANASSCISYLLYMSVVVYGQAIALQAAFSFSVYLSIIITISAAVIYTTIGGLRAVIWTDVLQFSIMMIGIMAALMKGTMAAGGTDRVWSVAARTGRLDFNFSADPTIRHTVWNLLFGRFVTGFGRLISPAALQRVNSTTGFKQSRSVALASTFGMAVITCSALILGVVAYAYYTYIQCDPLVSHQVDTPNQIILLMIMDVFHNLPGMPGLYLSALFSASLSTVSSLLSCMASITWYDVVHTCRPNMTDKRGLLISKATVVFYGVLAAGLAVLVSHTRSKTLLQVIQSLDAMMYSPLVALIYIGAFFRTTNVKGALAGLICGVVVTGWIVVGSMTSQRVLDTPYLTSAPTDQCPDFNVSIVLSSIKENSSLIGQNHHVISGVDYVYNLSYTLHSAVSILVVFIVGLAVSCATGGLTHPADPELVIQREDVGLWKLPPRIDRCRDTVESVHHDLLKETPDMENSPDSVKHSTSSV